MRPGDRVEGERLSRCLALYEAEVAALPGIAAHESRAVFIEQLIESERRNRYVDALLSRELGPRSENPLDIAFDPLKAAVIAGRRGDSDEACWLVFLFVQFGKHRRAGWRYAREIYGRLGQGSSWNWPRVRDDVPGFRTWLDANVQEIKGVGSRGFGNHRKYESLAGWAPNGTGAAVASYVDWVRSYGNHELMFGFAADAAANDPFYAFDILYRSMTVVERFGRTARFDYLAMVGKLDLAPIRPGKVYITGSTGPRAGATLLLGPLAEVGSTVIEGHLGRVEAYLNVGFDVLEDALCNWQKNPDVFKSFRG